MWSADANRWHCSQVPYKSSCFTKPCCAPESARSTGAALPLLAKFSAPQSQQKSHWLINPKPHMVDFQVYLDPLTCKVLLALTSLCRPVSETRTWSYTSILSMRSSTSKLPCERALNEIFLMRSQGFWRCCMRVITAMTRDATVMNAMNAMNAMLAEAWPNADSRRSQTWTRLFWNAFRIKGTARICIQLVAACSVSIKTYEEI